MLMLMLTRPGCSDRLSSPEHSHFTAGSCRQSCPSFVSPLSSPAKCRRAPHAYQSVARVTPQSSPQINISTWQDVKSYFVARWGQPRRLFLYEEPSCIYSFLHSRRTLIGWELRGEPIRRRVKRGNECREKKQKGTVHSFFNSVRNMLLHPTWL